MKNRLTRLDRSRTILQTDRQQHKEGDSMRYATLSNNQIHYTPNPIKVGDRVIGNPPEEVYIEQGFLPVIETEPPEASDGYYMESHWAERDGQIVQSWTVEEIPITDEEALTRYANELTGANDTTLIEAAETLITDRIKEE